MKEIIERVEKEKKELDKKLLDLHLFMNGTKYIDLEIDHKNLLQSQYKAMDSYSCILRNRLVLFEKDNK